MPGAGQPWLRPKGGAMQPGILRVVKEFTSESAVHGVVLISGLLVIVANTPDAGSKSVLVKVIATAFVFWLAHIYAGTVSHLGDHHEEPSPSSVRLSRALRYSLSHSWGMLSAALVPAAILGLGAMGLLSHNDAVWATLWADVALLAVLGFLGVSAWSPKLWVRLTAGAATALIGIALILLKARIH